MTTPSNESSAPREPLLDTLIANWGAVAAAVDRGYALTFDDYLNDVDLRQLIERRLSAATEQDIRITRELRVRLAQYDEIFRLATEPTTHCIWGDDNARDSGWGPEREWWYYRQPLRYTNDE